MKATFSNQSGFSLVETLMYIAILVLVVTMSTGILLLSNNSFKSALINRSLGRDGQGAVARVILEIRRGSSLNVADSEFGADPSTLAFYTTDDVGNPIEASVMVVGDALYLTKDDEMVSLTSSSTQVTTFEARRFSTVNSEGVNVELILSPVSNPDISATFFDTAIVRGGY
jgi:type II secretory pathway pseudopilin PulG